jgi:hypothetical protein
MGGCVMPAAYMNENGDWVKACSVCKEVQTLDQYYKHTPGHSSDGYKPRCRTCTKAKFRADNARRAKKRKQKSCKLDKLHVDWIREQQGKLSTRQAAKAFSKRFFAMKIDNSTVSRIWNNKIHVIPDGTDTMSIYDLLEGAGEFTGSVEEYIESQDDKKIKF